VHDCVEIILDITTAELRVTRWLFGRRQFILCSSNGGRLIEQQLRSGGGLLKSRPTGKNTGKVFFPVGFFRLFPVFWASLLANGHQDKEVEMPAQLDALMLNPQQALAYAENIIATLREPFVVLDQSLRVRTANASFYRNFHVSKEETEGHFVYDLGNGQWNIPLLRTLLSEVLNNTPTVEDFEVEHKFPTIGQRHMLLNARRFPPESNDPQLVLLAIEDNTDHRRAEEKLRNTEQRQRFVLDLMPQKIFTATPNGDVDYINPQWIEFTGMSFEEIKGWGWKQLIHPDNLEETVRVWKHSVATGESFVQEHRLQRADGEYLWHVSRALPMLDGADSILMWVGSNTDIHDIKLTEVAMRDSEIRYRRLFESAKDGILILDAGTGKVIDANPFMTALLGYSHEEFLGKELWEIGLFRDIEDSRAVYRQLQEKGYVRYEDLPLETRSGKKVEVEFVSNVYAEDHHHVVQCNIRDITERHNLLQQTQEQAAELTIMDRRKDEFLAMLGHELRNPLAPIVNAALLLRLHINKDRQKGIENPVLDQSAGIIERQAGQLSLLVDELLEVSRITTGRIQLHTETISLNTVVEHSVVTVRSLVEQKQHELTVSLPKQDIWLHADAARMEQVIVNLLTNAAKYTDPGGHVWLTLRKENNEAVLSVKDNGVGIDHDILPRIFDLFAQAKQSLDRSQGGLGIGLALVQRLLEMHGGTVEATSTVGKGSEFVVRLPVVSPPEHQSMSPPTDEAHHPPRPSLRVLVVDDNVDAVTTLAMLLRESGYDVRTAYDGLTVLETALDYRPGVVLLDIGLPGMNGYEVAKQIRRQPALRNTILIAMTGYGKESDRQTSKAAGFDYHLVKPGDFDKLLKILETISESLAT